MPIYSPAYYNAAALLGGGSSGKKRRKHRKTRKGAVTSTGGMSGKDLIKHSVPVVKGSAAAKAKMAALRAMRKKRRH